jgi:hypothetical protein
MVDILPGCLITVRGIDFGLTKKEVSHGSFGFASAAESVSPGY